MVCFHLITIFPEIFGSYLNESILKRAQQEKKIRIKVYNLRDFTDDKHKTVDDTPYGGGPGMVLKIEPIYKCVEYIKSKVQSEKCKVILTSAKGEGYTQKKAEDLKKYSDIIIICGRYEGVDERVAQYIADEEISIGKYVLTGGELPAMVIVDSVSRLLEGVLGNQESLKDSKFEIYPVKSDRVGSAKRKFKRVKNSKFKNGHPVYTKPDEFQGWKVPEVLLSGNHEEIGKWREKS